MSFVGLMNFLSTDLQGAAAECAKISFKLQSDLISDVFFTALPAALPHVDQVVQRKGSHPTVLRSWRSQACVVMAHIMGRVSRLVRRGHRCYRRGNLQSQRSHDVLTSAVFLQSTLPLAVQRVRCFAAGTKAAAKAEPEGEIGVSQGTCKALSVWCGKGWWAGGSVHSRPLIQCVRRCRGV